MSQGEEKTEKPTAQKRKQNRKEGQVPRTQELGAWAGMLAFALSLPPLVDREARALHGIMTSSLTAVEDASVERGLVLLGEGLWHVGLVLTLLGSAIMLVGVAGALAQGGFYLATKSVKPSFKKLSLISGAKRLFGLQVLWEGAKILLKSALAAYLVHGAIQTVLPLLGGLVPIPVVLEVVADDALRLLRDVAIAALVLAAADYGFQRHKVGKQTRMTKHEVKQEHKQQEGDPLVKSAIRGRQLAAARNRMMADVPQADVVLVNPTHVAVALRYDAQRGAPTVVARGAGEVAARIRAVAAESGVPLVRDVPLARSLFTSCDVGQEIPPELFAAVAQVLAFVLSRKAAGRTGGQHDSPRTGADLPAVAAAAARKRRTPTGPIPSGPAPAGR